MPLPLDAVDYVTTLLCFLCWYHYVFKMVFLQYRVTFLSAEIASLILVFPGLSIDTLS